MVELTNDELERISGAEPKPAPGSAGNIALDSGGGAGSGDGFKKNSPSK